AASFNNRLWRQWLFGRHLCFTYHHFLASKLKLYKSSIATKPAEKQKDQSPVLLLEASQEVLHLLALYCNIPSLIPNLS
ncbi:hypothetical protein AB4480_23270, partial [Vibrio sp. 10N.261.45.A4]